VTNASGIEWIQLAVHDITKCIIVYKQKLNDSNAQNKQNSTIRVSPTTRDELCT
jgi:hypothetical protein